MILRRRPYEVPGSVDICTEAFLLCLSEYGDSGEAGDGFGGDDGPQIINPGDPF